MTAIDRGGSWFVVSDGVDIAGPFDTSASAWRWIERHEGEPVSAAEKRDYWLFNQHGDFKA